MPGISTTIAGQEILGSLAVANNKGAILHPDVTVSEVEKIKDVLGVDVMVGTVGYGSPFVGAGMVSTPGVTYRMFRALSDENINILAISTSEIKLSVIIEENNILKAIKKLHTIFDLD